MNEERLAAVANDCATAIVRFATDRGLTGSDLGRHCWHYRQLTSAEQFRVGVMLCKTRIISVTIGVSGAFHFYPRSRAPDGAFNIGQRDPGAVIVAATGKRWR